MFGFVNNLDPNAHKAARAAVAFLLALLPWSLFGRTTETIQKGLTVPIEALNHPGVDAQVRAGFIRDSQLPEANEGLQPGIEPMRRTVEGFEQQLRFKVILEAVSGEEMYCRWGVGASESATAKPKAGGVDETRFGSIR